MMKRVFLLSALLFVSPAFASGEDAIAWGIGVQQEYMMVPNETYLVADSFESKLDVITKRPDARGENETLPVLLYIHGGGWVGGDKNRMYLHFLPYLAMGFAVVNVEYRLGRHALAPAAVEDCRCALRWVYANAARYGFDTSRIVVSGHSAGGHLSLTTGMLPAAAGLDRRCPGGSKSTGKADAVPQNMLVAAIVNWFGITDVADLIEGPNTKPYAVAWMGSQPDWKAIAERVSPLEYVRRGLPPILTLHGNADTIVPYDHAVRLHRALARARIPNRLHTIEGGGHGGFTLEENLAAMQAIRSFLATHKIIN